MKKGSKIVIIVVAVFAVLLSCFLFIHRRVIAAMIKGEELPPLPEGHPRCCPYCKGDEE